MKNVTIIFTAILLSLSLLAQVPQSFKYQTVARNNAGEILASQNISFQMTILQGELPGTVVYTETHAAATNAFGVTTLEIGRGAPVAGSFATINWSATPVFLKTEIDTAGGSAYVEMGTSELLSVPYAIYAGNGFTHYVGELFGGGIVFHVFKDADGTEHGLVVSLTDLSTSAPWGLYGIDVPNCESTWDGLSNTNSILTAGCLASDAAGICFTYNGGGFTDWYLPAKDELYQIYSNLFDLNRTIRQTPGATVFASVDYWSSSEYSSNHAWLQYFGDGGQYGSSKYGTNRVRAVRAF